MTQASRFRELLHRDGMVVAPGAYDCITAKLIAQAGFEAVYMTGPAPRRRSAIPISGWSRCRRWLATPGISPPPSICR
jgi:hypothetical protein